jgi:hypothetical protein
MTINFACLFLPFKNMGLKWACVGYIVFHLNNVDLKSVWRWVKVSLKQM